MNKKTDRSGQRPPIIGTLALLLTVVAVLTTPLAASKYVATGMGSAGARIAKFDPIITLDSGWPASAQSKYVLLNNGIGLTNYSGRTFTVKNNGETLIRAVPHLYYVGTANDVPGVTFSPSGNEVIGMGDTTAFTLNVGYSASHTVGTEYQVELFVHIEQVD